MIDRARTNCVMGLVLLVACGKAEPPAKCTGKHTSRVELRRVDEDSAFMKKLFARVGSDRKGAATDPAAIEAGVRAEIDQWTHDQMAGDLPAGETRHTDYYLMGPRTAIEAYLKQLVASDASFAVPGDREIVFERIDVGGSIEWRTYFVDKAVILDDAEIAFATIAIDPITNQPLTLAELTPSGKTKFADATRAQTGHKMATLVDGVVASAPIIMGTITGGRFSMRAESKAAAEKLVRGLGCTGSKN